VTAPVAAVNEGLAVAYSGGRDSTALLHATLHAARPLGLQVHALHVHHGLSRYADEWLVHCEERCRSWARRGWPVQLHHVKLALAPRPGQSVEALARNARYAALAQMAREQSCGLVLLAHHREDQAETFLLQALRGAGVAGLSAMPAGVDRAGVTWCRPWLQQSRAAIDAYVRRHRLRFVEDDSNADPRFARNRLRTQVWPVLAAAFPDAAHALGDAARWAQDASACLADLAQMDLTAVRVGADALRIDALFALGPARGRNALRAWLQARLGHAAPAALMERLWMELPHARPARWSAGGTDRSPGELRRYRGELRWRADVASPPDSQVPVVELAVLQPGPVEVMPWGGTLNVSRVQEGGVPLAAVRHLRLMPRSGGEQFQSAPASSPRSLKKHYQALGVPAWERNGPLVYGEGQLLFVPGLGLDARALARPGEPQVMLHWLRREAAGVP
jgi:tRNA(Ile)-lysidine synthase